VYTFRDSAGPILEQLTKTSPAVVIGICLMAAVYQIIEGIITTVLAKQYRSSFACKNGITNAFLCSFYRVATLGSGSGVAAIIYLGEQGIEYGGGFGLYMIQYALHKMSIALFSAILFVMNWEFMKSWFGDYAGLLAGGYAVTLVITIGLFLFCCSKKFHRLIFWLLDIVNQKFHGRFEIMEAEIKRQCMMLEDASKHLLKNKKATTGVIFLCLLKCCFWYGIPYLLFKGVQFQGNPALTLSQVLAITSLSVMLAAVIPSPAGIGSTEFVFTTLFAGIVGTGMAGSASLLYRFGTFVFPFLVGTVVVLIRHFRRKKISGNRI
jgi:uncharacterized membrane protein YbhN (UPF0104 family)